MSAIFEKSDIFKYIIGLILVTILRFLIIIPNVQPLMAFLLPFAKYGGWAVGIFYGFVAVLLFDLLAGQLGVWTLATAGTYALLGLLFSLFLRNKPNEIKYYLGATVLGTIFYDAVTGLGLGVLVFNQPFFVTLSGQIPFTLYHLAGNITTVALLSPIIYRWILNNRNLQTGEIIARIRPAG